eukprot:TRINITY_DN1974_c0_g2_i3.p1 TRINITY_DN1974_c0_g2~~TRINITY_DN1974_c0_g2_i3.p1  ORF type:complete len:195 (+),score=33.45 TRINITY_DN1974_c0_g2_i3:235-819(+)
MYPVICSKQYKNNCSDGIQEVGLLSHARVQFECYVCLETLSDPVTFPNCFHSVCLKCFTKQAEEEEKRGSKDRVVHCGRRCGNSLARDAAVVNVPLRTIIATATTSATATACATPVPSCIITGCTSFPSVQCAVSKALCAVSGFARSEAPACSTGLGVTDRVLTQVYDAPQEEGLLRQVQRGGLSQPPETGSRT